MNIAVGIITAIYLGVTVTALADFHADNWQYYVIVLPVAFALGFLSYSNN